MRKATRKKKEATAELDLMIGQKEIMKQRREVARLERLQAIAEYYLDHHDATIIGSLKDVPDGEHHIDSTWTDGKKYDEVLIKFEADPE